MTEGWGMGDGGWGMGDGGWGRAGGVASERFRPRPVGATAVARSPTAPPKGTQPAVSEVVPNGRGGAEEAPLPASGTVSLDRRGMRGGSGGRGGRAKCRGQLYRNPPPRPWRDRGGVGTFPPSAVRRPPSAVRRPPSAVRRPAMHLADLRTHCLAKPGATEDLPFGPDTLVFKVAGKVFALANLEWLPPAVNLKCDPERAVELRETYADVAPGYHMSKRHWTA